MANYKEIVTKAVIGKGKKKYVNKYSISSNDKVDTVLGCWVINHQITGRNNNGVVNIDGSFDVNIWYSYDNNTKTNVLTERVSYNETAKVRLKESSELNDSSDIIIRSLRNPNCTDVDSDGSTITYTIEKELGIEIIGETKVRIMIEDDEDDYEEIIEEEVTDNVIDDIDKNVSENYIKEN